MKSFLLMLSFFTRLPVPHVQYEEELYKKGIKYVPIIGLVMGLILYGMALGAEAAGKYYGNSNHLITLLVVLISYVILTGGLHLDGLADTADGMFSGRDKERMLAIMKDSHIGTFGVIALLLWMASFAVVIEGSAYNILVIFPIVGKSCMITSAYSAPYAREDGFGKVFIDGCQKRLGLIAWAILLPFVLSYVICGPSAVVGVLFAFLACAVLTGYIRKKLGGITGDTLGFVCEITQLVFGLISIIILI